MMMKWLAMMKKVKNFKKEGLTKALFHVIIRLQKRDTEEIKMEKMNKIAARKMWNEGKEFWITACNNLREMITFFFENNLDLARKYLDKNRNV